MDPKGSGAKGDLLDYIFILYSDTQLWIKSDETYVLTTGGGVDCVAEGDILSLGGDMRNFGGTGRVGGVPSRPNGIRLIGGPTRSPLNVVKFGFKDSAIQTNTNRT